MNLDKIFIKVGEFDRYQKFLFIFFCLPTILLDSIASFVQIFLGTTPEHWCLPTEQDEHLLHNQLNLTIDEVRNVTSPMVPDAEGEMVPSSCKIFHVNYTSWYEREGGIPYNESLPQQSCQHGWHYDQSVYKETIVTQWDLVCDNDYFQSMMLTLVTFGGVLGTFIFGFITDRIGRRKAYFLCWLVMTLSNCLTPLSPNITVFGVLRVFSGVAVTPIYQIAFVHMLEFVGPNKRTLISQCISICYSLGYMLLALMAYFIRDWQTLSLAAGLPWIPLIIWWWWLPESPRWLLSQGRVKEAEEIISRVARFNGCNLPDNFLELHIKQEERERDSNDSAGENTNLGVSQVELVPSRTTSQIDEIKVVPDEMGSCESGYRASYLDLFKAPAIRIITVILTINWIANIMVYDGMSYLTTELEVNDFIAFFVSGAVEIPAYILCWLVVDRVGRKWPMCVSMIVTALLLLLVAAVPSGDIWITFTMTSLSKLGISFGYTLLYLYASELFPTTLRAQGVSLASNIAHLLDMLTPYVIYLQRYGRLIPFFILGSLCAGAGVSVIFLQETLNKVLPERVEDVENPFSLYKLKQLFKRRSKEYDVG